MEHMRLYESGIPFYTKEAIKHLNDQLERIRQSGPGEYEVSVSTLLGNTVTQKVSFGKDVIVGPSHRKGYNWVSYGPPLVDYKKYDYFMYSKGHPRYPVEDDGAMLGAMNPMYYQDEATGEKDPCRVDRSLEETRTCFQETANEWESSDQCKKLLSLLDSTSDLPRVRNIVAFATSSLSWNWKNRFTGAEIVTARVQLALVLILRDYLEKRQPENSPVRCFAQEPWFSEIDVQVLQEHGITVVDDPKGFLEVDGDTLIIVISPDIPVRSIIADIARPAIMIWDKVIEPRPDDPSYTDPVTPRIIKMVQEYQEFDFPDGDTSHVDPSPSIYSEPSYFGRNPAIYIRKTKLDDDASVSNVASATGESTRAK